MVYRSYVQRHMYARNKVKLCDNEARTQRTSRAKPDQGSIHMNDNIGLALYSTLRSLVK